MDLEAVMGEIGDALGVITGLRIGVVGEKVVPPAAFVAYPETVTYDVTYGRGADQFNPSVVVVVGKLVARSTRQKILAYANGSGDDSVKAAVEGGSYAECDSIRVTQATFDVVTIGSDDYMAVIFDLDVIGQGST